MPKQAVLLIHGIGEQRPMETLRGFVESVWTTDHELQRKHGAETDGLWSKPYELTADFELRRFTTARNRAGLRTDFFEFYWAHLMGGTQISDVTAWAWTLLVRDPGTVPRQLRLAYWLLVVLAVAGAGLALWMKLTWGEKDGPGPGLSFLLSVLVVAPALFILRNVVGDAARYLRVAPTNIQCRHEIRAAGVAVLKKLHEEGYDRIIVVGHSLGSVIGYDILYHAWLRYHANPPGEPSAFAALNALEELARSAAPGSREAATKVQEVQRKYFEEMRSNGSPWRVTDFVTLGSPLAHAEILLAPKSADLRLKFANREFATCPPALESKKVGEKEIRTFSYPPLEIQRVPHHAALFGPVCWTNLYFPCRWILWGDVIGGPLRKVFGGWIHDVPVHTRIRGGVLSHTEYWTREGNDGEQVRELRKALDLLDERGGVART